MFVEVHITICAYLYVENDALHKKITNVISINVISCQISSWIIVLFKCIYQCWTFLLSVKDGYLGHGSALCFIVNEARPPSPTFINSVVSTKIRK